MLNPKVRKVVYALAAGAGAVLVALGVVDANVSDQILTIIGGVLALGVGGLAAPNTPAKATPAEVLEARAEAAKPAVTVRVDPSAVESAVERARREVEKRLGR
ncbi:hypothetical protein GS463_27670 [Rhodococcus hoagii]|nr:hypothetical protein [Prescottella equi]MBM4538770.1 hypothetical protein [Prescottella equi]MBM4538920.1 hypothetical protein [Prescottella equi]MBM4542756.1 hypothetical protein [Prescottella equi]